MRTLILSDIHLGSRHANVGLVNEVLDREPFDRLILLGDTINNVNFRKFNGQHWALLERFRRLARERDLVLIRGNHDHETDHNPERPEQSHHQLGTHRVLPAMLEVPMIEEYRLEINHQPYLLLHGDRFDPTLRYPVVTEVAGFCYQLTTKLNKKLAKWLKKKSKRWGGVLEFVRNQAVALARKEKSAGIIAGHTHFAEDSYIDDVHYVNTGCWTEFPCTYVTVAPQTGLTLHYMAD